MARTRIATLMMISLMLSLVISGVQSTVLHPSLMDHGPAMMDHGAVEPHDHAAGSMPDHSHASSDDCRLKCVLAMCVPPSAVLTGNELHYPREAAVMTASVTHFLSQSHPENPYRPPIAV